MSYEVTHIAGKGNRFPVLTQASALKLARERARSSGHRFAVLHAGTDNVVAVVWPDGGTDFQPKGTKLQ